MIRLAQPPFLSVQGEGPRTGILTIFVRFFGCNLRCKGFFQNNPLDPNTYIKPLLIDPKLIKTLDDFPVVEVGCDTLYAVDPKFKHLAIDYNNEKDIVDAIESLLPKNNNGTPTWKNKETNNVYDLCFTGGEPLLHQDAISKILEEIYSHKEISNLPNVIQFETNGTQELNDNLIFSLSADMIPVLFNVSPKLQSVSGEFSDKAWFPDIISNLTNYGNVSLKFVVNETNLAFDELELKVKEFKSKCDIPVPIYIMPVGSSFKQQSDYEIINKISKKAIERGYNISGRLHCILFGNSSDR